MARTNRRSVLKRVAAGGAALAAGGAGPSLCQAAESVPVLAEADIVVCGGGPAGIASAYCAARQGAKVLLVERWPSLGGMATNALVNIWHTSDRTKQVIFGVVQEAVERAGEFIRRYPDFPKRPETHEFDPEGMRVVFWRMLADAGVRVICNLTAVQPVVQDGRVHSVCVDTKRGRKALRGRIFIDATGDGDLAAAAGVPFDLGRSSDGRVQGMTMMFCLRDIDHNALRAAGNAKADQVLAMMKDLRDAGKFPPFNEGAARHYLRTGPTHLPYNMCPVTCNPLDEEELTRASARAREQVFQYLALWRKEMPGFKNARVTHMGYALGVRESRRVRGRKTLDAAMVVKAVKQKDAVGHGFWMIDIHDPKGSGHTTWTDQKPETMPPAGQSYHIPLGICLNEQVANLGLAGRCASATHEATASVRLQSHCMVMGQGLGTAAAMALQAGEDMHQVDAGRLQAALRKAGAYIEDVPGGT